MSSSQPNYLPNTLSPNTLALGAKDSTHKFWGTQFNSQQCLRWAWCYVWVGYRLNTTPNLAARIKQVRTRVSHLTIQALLTILFSSSLINLRCLFFLIRLGQSQPIWVEWNAQRWEFCFPCAVSYSAVISFSLFLLSVHQLYGHFAVLWPC